MRYVLGRTTLVLFLSCVLTIQTMGLHVRAESSELPSSWTVERYGDSSHFLIPKSINNNGVATAQLQTADGFFPVELSGGQIVMLGDGTVQGAPTGINDQGVIVGYSINPDGSTSAAVFAPGSVTELNAGAAWDIDESGTIVGSVNGVAAYWPQGGEPLALPVPTDEESAQVLAINEEGLMVGTAETHAVAWRDGQVVDGWYAPGNASTQLVAIDVNDAGMIVGEKISTPDGATGQSNTTFAPFTWQDEKLNELPLAAGDTSCEVDAINNSGWIAGGCGHGEAQHAILWVDGEVIEIGPLLGDGWQAVVATDVNDMGQIIGQGFLNGVVVAFVLTPA